MTTFPDYNSGGDINIWTILPAIFICLDWDYWGRPLLFLYKAKVKSGNNREGHDCCKLVGGYCQAHYQTLANHIDITSFFRFACSAWNKRCCKIEYKPRLQKRPLLSIVFLRSGCFAYSFFFFYLTLLVLYVPKKVSMHEKRPHKPKGTKTTHCHPVYSNWYIDVPW